MICYTYHTLAAFCCQEKLFRTARWIDLWTKRLEGWRFCRSDNRADDLSRKRRMSVYMSREADTFVRIFGLSCCLHIFRRQAAGGQYGQNERGSDVSARSKARLQQAYFFCCRTRLYILSEWCARPVLVNQKRGQCFRSDGAAKRLSVLLPLGKERRWQHRDKIFSTSAPWCIRLKCGAIQRFWLQSQFRRCFGRSDCIGTV